jgi:hypothetical protein
MKVDPKPPDEAVETAGKKRSIGDQVIRWGAIAGAVTAIVGAVVLVASFFTTDPDPTLDARLEALDIQSEVAFGEFEGRQELAATSWDVNLSLASAVVTQPSPIGKFEGQAFLRQGSSPRDVVLQRARVPRMRANIQLPDGCELTPLGDEIKCETTQPLSWADSGQNPVGPGGGGGGKSDDEAIASAREFLKVLKDTRQREVVRDGRPVIEPLGVTVSFEAVVEGYRDEELEVRWSLYRSGSRKPIGRDWLVNRRVLSFEPESNRQRVAQEFWVPLPRDEAPSFIRVTLYDRDRQAITRRDTKRFR